MSDEDSAPWWIDEGEYAPKIGGLPAILDVQPPEYADFRAPDGTIVKKDIITLGGLFSYFRCPHCKASLGGEIGADGRRRYICLNACHLTAGQRQRFSALFVPRDPVH